MSDVLCAGASCICVHTYGVLGAGVYAFFAFANIRVYRYKSGTKKNTGSGKQWREANCGKKTEKPTKGKDREAKER